MRRIIYMNAEGHYEVGVRRGRRRELSHKKVVATCAEAELYGTEILAKLKRDAKDRKARRRPPQLVELQCSGGCGKKQRLRPRKAALAAMWDAVGCGKCSGWQSLFHRPVRRGMTREIALCVAGFWAFRDRIRHRDEDKAIARAAALAGWADAFLTS